MPELSQAFDEIVRVMGDHPVAEQKTDPLVAEPELALFLEYSLSEVEHKALALLRDTRQLRVPVPIITVAQMLDIDVLETDFADPSTSGAIIAEDGSYKIYVKRNEPEERRRFTVAHELGHFVLHLNRARVKDRGFLDLGNEEDYVAAFRGSSRGPQEEAANSFAAELLMPRTFLRLYIEGGFTVDEMARRFVVSRTAMRRRVSAVNPNVP